MKAVAPGDTPHEVGTDLSGPGGVAVDSSGNTYVADLGDNRVVRIALDGSQTKIGHGLKSPSGVAVDPAGDVYVADTGNGRVVVINPDGTQAVAVTSLAAPSAVAVAPNGDLVVADRTANQVVNMTSGGLRTIIGSGLSAPHGVAVDPAGNIFVADTGNNRVVEFASDGQQRSVGAQLLRPRGVAVDRGGNVYVADTGHHRVLSVSGAGTQTELSDIDAYALAVYVARQDITATSQPPNAGVVGHQYVATATGGASGQPISFTADPTSTACLVDPDGVVSFQSVGTCVVDIDQNGSAYYAPAPTVSQQIVVGTGTQSIQFTSSVPSDARVGQQYQATALGGDSGQPVVFSVGPGVAACTATPDGQVTFVATGSCVIDADQDGNDDFAAAPQMQQSMSVARGEQVISFGTSPPTQAYVGDSYTVIARGGPSGAPVLVTADESSTGCTIDSDGTVSFTSVGTCVIDAAQAGNDDYAPAAQQQQTLTVSAGGRPIVFTSQPPASPSVGGLYIASATGGTNGDPIVFAADPDSVGCTVDADGTVTFVHVGTCLVDARQPGSGNPQAQQSMAIVRGAQRITFTSSTPADPRVGGKYTASATGGPSGQPVTFSAGASSTGCTVGAHGLIDFVAAGACVVTAHEVGDRDYEPAPTASQSITVKRAVQTIHFTSTPPSDAAVGQSYVVTATGGRSGNPVMFSATSSSTHTCTVTADGLVHFIGAGNCGVNATQDGSADYLPAPKTKQGVKIRIAQTITFTSSPPVPAIVGANYTVTATGGGSDNPVTFSTAARSASVCSVNGSNTVTFTGQGSCTIVAAQAGTSAYAPAPEVDQTVTVMPGSTGTDSPIKHVVLIYQENHSFDETFGTYCAGRAIPCDGYVGPVTLKDGTRVQMKESPDVVPNVRHSVEDQLAALDGGAMDGWAGVRHCEAPEYKCLTYYNRDEFPNLANLADQFTVSDQTFELEDSPSFGGHVYAAAATLDGFTGVNPTKKVGYEAKGGWGCDSDKVAQWQGADGKVINVPSCVPKLDGTGAFLPTPVQHVPTIFDRLEDAQKSWRIYGAVKPPGALNTLGYEWSICPTFADCLYSQQVQNLVTSDTILDDAAAGTLPSYSILTPSVSSAAAVGTDSSQHNDTSMIAGDNWIGQVVSAIQNGPDWDSTAIFITYDDCGCFYDHVTPGTNPDGTPQGIRIPMVIVSPYAKAGGLDSNNATFASVLAFAEHTLGLPPLGTNDASAYDYTDSFDFAQTPQRGTVMHQHHVPPSSVRYAKAHPDTNDPT